MGQQLQHTHQHYIATHNNYIDLCCDGFDCYNTHTHTAGIVTLLPNYSTTHISIFSFSLNEYNERLALTRP
jgi:hypothetical protein